MAINKDILGPKNDAERETFDIEALVFSVQIALQKVMNEKGLSNADLAKRLGMSPARVSQIFSSTGANLTLRTIARISHALDEEFELVRKTEAAEKPKASSRKFDINALLETRSNRTVWRETKPHNKNNHPKPVAA